MRMRLAQLSSLTNRTRRLRCYMIRDITRKGKLGKQPLQPVLVL